MDAKLLLGVVIVGTFFVSETYDRAINFVTSESDSSSDLTQEQLNLLEGKDPTDVLPATAAGGEQEEVCRSGIIDAGANAQSFDKKMYVSFKEGGISYILIGTSPKSWLFLQQDSFQATTANLIHPEQEIKEQLGEYFENHQRCRMADLYLSRVKRSQIVR